MEEWRARLFDAVRRRRPVRVLEAGGGAKTRIPLDDARYTVIEISSEALARTGYAQELILGDLQTFDYGDRRFDAAIFWDVLEHLDEPSAALIRACRALEPGGVVVIKGPLLRSMRGLVTRFTPFWFHVAYYRFVLGAEKAGSPGYLPYPTVHARDADPRRLIPVLSAYGLQIEHFETFAQGDRLRSRFPIIYRLYRLAAAVLARISCGRYGGLASDFVLVAAKPPLAVEPALTASAGRSALERSEHGTEQRRATSI